MKSKNNDMLWTDEQFFRLQDEVKNSLEDNFKNFKNPPVQFISSISEPYEVKIDSIHDIDITKEHHNISSLHQKINFCYLRKSLTDGSYTNSLLSINKSVLAIGTALIKDINQKITIQTGFIIATRKQNRFTSGFKYKSKDSLNRLFFTKDYDQINGNKQYNIIADLLEKFSISLQQLISEHNIDEDTKPEVVIDNNHHLIFTTHVNNKIRNNIALKTLDAIKKRLPKIFHDAIKIEETSDGHFIIVKFSNFNIT